MESELVFLNAARSGQIETVRRCVMAGINPNVRNEFGRTALIAAAQQGNTEVVKYLLSLDVDIFAKDDLRLDAFQVATETGHEDILSLLQEHSK